MILKVGRIDISVTANGTPKALVYPEGTDFSNPAEGIELLGDNDVLYLGTRKEGDEIEVVEKGRWRNVIIPDEYLKALNSASYDRFKLLFKRAIGGINKVANGTRTPIDLEATELIIANNTDIFSKVYKQTLDTLKQTDTEFAKVVCEDIKSKDLETRYKAIEVLFRLTQANIREISTDYKITNDGLEPKTK